MQLTAKRDHVPDSFDDFVSQTQDLIYQIPKDTVILRAVGSGSLSALYLKSLPKPLRQHHNCRVCLKFIDDYGWAYYVTTGTQLRTVFWDLMPRDPVLAKVVAALRNAVLAAADPVNDLTHHAPDGSQAPSAVGTRQTGQFTHFHFKNVPFWRESKAKAHERIRLVRALGDDPKITLNSLGWLAKYLMVLPQAQDLVRQVTEVGDILAEPQLTRTAKAVKASEAAAHFRASLAYSLLGLPRAEAVERAKTELNGLKYQRGSAVSEGLVEKAEQALHHMQPAMKRTFATLAYIQDHTNLLWEAPQQPAPRAERMFGHIAPKGPVPRTNDRYDMGVISVKKFLEIVSASKPREIRISGVVAEHHLTAPTASLPQAFHWTEEQGDVGYYCHADANGNLLTMTLSRKPVSFVWVANDGTVRLGWQSTLPQCSPVHWGIWKQTLRSQYRGFAALLEKHSTTAKALARCIKAPVKAAALSSVPLQVELTTCDSVITCSVVDLKG